MAPNWFPQFDMRLLLVGVIVLLVLIAAIFVVDWLVHRYQERQVVKDAERCLRRLGNQHQSRSQSLSGGRS
jgi:uncharacterized membrane protein